MNWAGNYKVPLESFQIAGRAELYPRQPDNVFSVFMLTNNIGSNLTLSWSEGKMSLKNIWKFRSLASISTFLSSVTWLSLSFWVSVLFCHQNPGNCLEFICSLLYRLNYIILLYSSTPVLILTGGYQNYHLTWTLVWSSIQIWSILMFMMVLRFSSCIILSQHNDMIHASQALHWAIFGRQCLKLHDKLPCNKIFITRVEQFFLYK